MAGWMPVLGRAGYCAAKSALGQAIEVLRAEIGRDGIGLLMVYPSFLDTPIERNALGAVKAVTAASLALKGDGTHFVPLDAAIETMRQTGLDMNEKYKETSLGGLAVNVVEC